MNRIIIDAGHGGYDPGVTWNGRLEKDIVLDYSLTLKYRLVNEGFQVKLTRTGDYYPDLRDRTKHPGDLFISLHMNSAKTYPLIYYSPGYNSFELAGSIDYYFQSGKLWPTSVSRFGRLYIQDAPMPSVLVELGAIDTIINTKEERIRVSEQIIAGIRLFQAGQ